MNEQQKLSTQKTKNDPVFEYDCSSPIHSSSDGIKSFTLISSLVNIFPELNSPNSSNSRNQIPSSGRSLTGLSPTERMNYYVSKLQNMREQYEKQIQEELMKIKIIRMKEEKEKEKQEQGPYQKHMKQFVIRKSPDEFEKQKFLPISSEKLNSVQQKKQKLKQQYTEVNNESDDKDSAKKQQNQKQKEEEIICNREKGWRQCRGRYDLFINSFKESSSLPTTKNILSNFKINTESVLTQNTFLSNRKGSNPDLMMNRKQSPNAQNIIRPQTGIIQTKQGQQSFNSFRNTKYSNSNLVKSILKQNQRNNNKDLSIKDDSPINSENFSIRRVNFQNNTQLFLQQQ